MVLHRTGHFYEIRFGRYVVRGDFVGAERKDGEWWFYFAVAGVGRMGFDLETAKKAKELE